MINKINICVALSGGETSAFMAKWVKANYPSCFFNVAYVFANTGQENEETLEFVEMLRIDHGINAVWVEAVTHFGIRKGCTHKIIDFKTASRKGEPFEDMSAKYGVPNKHFIHCTRELKENPIKSYLRSIGWGSSTEYTRLIGIRVDELDRIAEDYESKGLYYPLAFTNPLTKLQINAFWESQPKRLELKQYQGNCKWCYKKTLRKHLTIISENPEWYDFPRMLETNYSHVKPKEGETERRIFRGERTVEDLFKLSLEPFEPFHDEARVYDPELDSPNGGCAESCEPFAA